MWDATYGLLEYFGEHGGRLLGGRVVVELGSGTGLAGEYREGNAFSSSVESLALFLLYAQA